VKWNILRASLGRQTLVGKTLSFTHELFSFFYQSTMLSSHAKDRPRMYFRGSVVGKASTIGIGISPTPPLISTEGAKNAKFGVV